MTLKSEPPKLLVIGAQGLLGGFLSSTFREAGWEVTRAGRRPDPGEDFLQLDLDDPEALGAAIEAADLTVNTVHHHSLAPERAALERGGALLNLPELSAAERASLRDRGAESSGSVITDAGLSAVGYLALADLIASHPEADGASYALMFSAAGVGGRAGALFAHAVLTDCRHHPTARFELPEPWGSVRAFEIGTGSQLGSITADIVGVPLRHYLSLRPRPLQLSLLALNSLRLISLLPRASFTAGTKKEVSEASDEPICEFATLTRGGAEVASVTIEGRGYYSMTSAAILTYAEALLANQDLPGGFLPIEQVLQIEQIAAGLAARGIEVQRHLGPRTDRGGA